MNAIKTATSARLRWVIDKLRLKEASISVIKVRPRSLLQDRENHPRWRVSVGTLREFQELELLSGGEFERSTLGLYGPQLKSGVSDKIAIAQKSGIFSKTERVGFEPTEPFSSPDFKSGAFDHSATSPGAYINLSYQQLSLTTNSCRFSAPIKNLF